jgi:hypothetical protein
MSDLVQRLTEEQDVEVSLWPEPTLQALRATLDRGYIHMRFPQTRGGTELGISIDRERSDLGGVDLEHEKGSIEIIGQLVLDYTKVRFHGTIDVATLKGTGHLEPLDGLS